MDCFCSSGSSNAFQPVTIVRRTTDGSDVVVDRTANLIARIRPFTALPGFFSTALPRNILPARFPRLFGTHIAPWLPGSSFGKQGSPS